MSLVYLRSCLCFILLFNTVSSIGQISTKPDTINNKRLNKLIIIGGTSYAASMIGLNYLWYKDFERESFHFFNDNSEWKQIDKLGHFYSTYQISAISSGAFKWAGVPKKKAHFWGALTATFIMMPIEVLDGFSSAYGASWGDIIANTSGAFMHYGQYAMWREQRIYPKLSFQRSGLAHLRPELLGRNLQEEILKDYNGHTIWLSFDLVKFNKNEKNHFPKWLNLGLGYGANNMIYARDMQNEANGYEAYRQFYIGVDFDLSHIKTKSSFVKALLNTVNLIHLPAPTLEIDGNGKVRFHPLYF